MNQPSLQSRMTLSIPGNPIPNWTRPAQDNTNIKREGGNSLYPRLSLEPLGVAHGVTAAFMQPHAVPQSSNLLHPHLDGVATTWALTSLLILVYTFSSESSIIPVFLLTALQQTEYITTLLISLLGQFRVL